jgi:hypothetical protein
MAVQALRNELWARRNYFLWGNGRAVRSPQLGHLILRNHLRVLGKQDTLNFPLLPAETTIRRVSVGSSTTRDILARQQLRRIRAGLA